MAIVSLPSVTGAKTIEEVINTVENMRKQIEFLLNNVEKDNVKSVEFSTVQNVSIGTATIQDLAVTTAKIGLAQIVTANIGNAQITTALIGDAQITSALIANAQITNAHIANATIDGNAKIQSASIGTALIATSAIQTAQIADASITDAKIVTLTADKISAGKIDTSIITIQGLNSKLKITGNRLQVFDNQATPIERISLGDVNGNGTVYGFRVRGADGTTVLMDETGVKSQGYTDGSITNLKIQDSAVDNRTVLANSLTGDRLVIDAITAREIAAKTITANEIAANTITAASGIIANLAITNAMIADATISSAKIVSLDASKITTGTLTAITINGVTINGSNITSTWSDKKIQMIDGTLISTNLTYNQTVKVNANRITFDDGVGHTGEIYYIGGKMWFTGNGTSGSGGLFTFNRDIEAQEGYYNVGLKSAYSWSGSLAAASGSVNIVHNLGYNPMVTAYGTAGNLELTYTVNVSGTSIYVTNYSSGSNVWTGTVYLW